jgi:hypothetical protein
MHQRQHRARRPAHLGVAAPPRLVPTGRAARRDAGALDPVGAAEVDAGLEAPARTVGSVRQPEGVADLVRHRGWVVLAGHRDRRIDLDGDDPGVVAQRPVGEARQAQHVGGQERDHHVRVGGAEPLRVGLDQDLVAARGRRQRGQVELLAHQLDDRPVRLVDRDVAAVARDDVGHREGLFGELRAQASDPVAQEPGVRRNPLGPRPDPHEVVVERQGGRRTVPVDGPLAREGALGTDLTHLDDAGRQGVGAAAARLPAVEVHAVEGVLLVDRPVQVGALDAHALRGVVAALDLDQEGGVAGLPLGVHLRLLAPVEVHARLGRLVGHQRRVARHLGGGEGDAVAVLAQVEQGLEQPRLVLGQGLAVAALDAVQPADHAGAVDDAVHQVVEGREAEGVVALAHHQDRHLLEVPVGAAPLEHRVLDRRAEVDRAREAHHDLGVLEVDQRDVAAGAGGAGEPRVGHDLLDQERVARRAQVPVAVAGPGEGVQRARAAQHRALRRVGEGATHLRQESRPELQRPGDVQQVEGAQRLLEVGREGQLDPTLLPPPDLDGAAGAVELGADQDVVLDPQRGQVREERVRLGPLALERSDDGERQLVPKDRDRVAPLGQAVREHPGEVHHRARPKRRGKGGDAAAEADEARCAGVGGRLAAGGRDQVAGEAGPFPVPHHRHAHQVGRLPVGVRRDRARGAVAEAGADHDRLGVGGRTAVAVVDGEGQGVAALALVGVARHLEPLGRTEHRAVAEVPAEGQPVVARVAGAGAEGQLAALEGGADPIDAAHGRGDVPDRHPNRTLRHPAARVLDGDGDVVLAVVAVGGEGAAGGRIGREGGAVPEVPAEPHRGGGGMVGVDLEGDDVALVDRRRVGAHAGDLRPLLRPPEGGEQRGGQGREQQRAEDAGGDRGHGALYGPDQLGRHRSAPPAARRPVPAARRPRSGHGFVYARA